MSKEHNFVSAVVYLHNCAGGITSFLSMLQGQLDANFERYEIVCVNDASADDSAEKARSFARERDFPSDTGTDERLAGPGARHDCRHRHRHRRFCF